MANTTPKPFVSLDEFARHLEELYPPGERDFSIDIATYVALALIGLRRLEAAGVTVSIIDKHPLVAAWLERAFRDVLWLRQNNVPLEMQVKDIPRVVTLTRFGKVLSDDADKAALYAFRRYYSDANHQIERRKGDARARSPQRLRARRGTQPAKSGDPGSGPKGS